MLPESILKEAQEELLDWQASRYVNDRSRPSNARVYRFNE